ncbi:MAG: stringent starvation protein B [Deltaproteobacteria bacterium]|nr:stringent starvation protein B [Deltaproteobacteria bacterium]
MTDQRSPKHLLVDKLLELGMVMVIVDSRRPGVEVPPQFAGDPQLRLNLSLRFPSPMTLDVFGVAAVLTFAGVPFACRLPWDSIYVVFSHVSGDPYVFPEDVPAEAFAAVTPAVNHPPPPEVPEVPQRKPPALHLVTAAEVASDTAETGAAGPPDEPPPTPDPRRAHLRVVK